MGNSASPSPRREESRLADSGQLSAKLPSIERPEKFSTPRSPARSPGAPIRGRKRVGGTKPTLVRCRKTTSILLACSCPTIENGVENASARARANKNAGIRVVGGRSATGRKKKCTSDRLVTTRGVCIQFSARGLSPLLGEGLISSASKNSKLPARNQTAVGRRG